ncbi:hypothetical protein FSP39_025076 [Pinctada imbricata]|uniref:C1q domain-containing protein n=1 Tax=Pinctada imbricata TaxID=66713 RepID=A0AA88Y446_PINIB|nr:hypothetical protein FSP39_025076 [Pinctada imbricata]
MSLRVPCDANATLSNRADDCCGSNGNRKETATGCTATARRKYVIYVHRTIDFRNIVWTDRAPRISTCSHDEYVTSLQSSLYELTDTVRNQAAEVQRLKSELEDAKPLPNVAFTVRLGKEVTLSANETLPFDSSDIITNIGNAYNSSDSKFHCPQSGLYYFHSMICSQKSSKARALIVRNNGTDIIGFLYAEDQSNYDCGGNGVVEKLDKGDTVWIMSFFTSHFDTNSFFTGMYLSKE